MSASSEYEPVAHQVYGPASTSDNVYEHVLEPKLADMNVPNSRVPILRGVSREQEPDSTNPENIVHSRSKEMPIETLSGIVRIEDGTLDSMGRVTFPILQDDDSNDGYIENHSTTKHYDIIQTPLNTTLVQNVGKIQQNYAINVDAANIATIHNVSQDVAGGQTLWLPTLLTSAASAVEKDDDRSTSVSQYIIASDSYDAQPRRPSVPESTYSARHKNKVQIISNISLPNKSSTYTQQYAGGTKEIGSTSLYTQANHIYKLGNISSQKGNSIICSKNKNQPVVGCPPVVNNSTRNIAYAHAITKTNKVNNGANLNAMVAAATSNAPCHIVSRVGTNASKSAHPKKCVNSVKSKNSANSQKNSQSTRSIKIIQQTGSVQKNDGKSWSANNTSPYKNQNYGVIESGSKIIQKIGSPTSKSVPIQKVSSKEGLLLQSPVGSVLISSAPLNSDMCKSQYVQAGPTPNLRYVQTYGNPDHNASQISANQQLTAQILQSLSQPKLMMPMAHVHRNAAPILPTNEADVDYKPPHQRKIFGDSLAPCPVSPVGISEDNMGTECKNAEPVYTSENIDTMYTPITVEKADPSEDLMRHSVQTLAFVMLDHTYSQPLPKMALTSSPVSVLNTIAAVTPSITTCAGSVPQAAVPPFTMSTQPSLVTESLASAPTLMVSSAVSYSRIQSPPPASPRSPRRDDSDTETAPSADDEGKTRCICDFTHDDGYMICCDRCGEWQHVDCMAVDRDNIPDSYMCELCDPRPVDRRRARNIQQRKKEELSALQENDDRDDRHRRKRLLTVTTYCDTSVSTVASVTRAVQPTTTPLPISAPVTSAPLVSSAHRRGPKKSKKVEILRKGTKRKLSDKKVKRKKDMMLTRKCGNNTPDQSHWQESYEQAMTNHYSPELRAKIIRYSSKLGNMSNMSSAITAHQCTNVPHAGGKILIATRDLKENTPVIELRGKYMLSNQHKPQMQNSRTGGQKPGPYVFFYRLPKDNTQICIDTRTYGNEARFVRRSCKPNAELQHCIIKGALHVYLATISPIQADTEITVGHESNNGKQLCACGNPKHCKVNGMTSLVTRKTCDYPLREKRLRTRGSSPQTPSPVTPPPTVMPPTPNRELSPLPIIKFDKKTPIKHEVTVLSPVKTSAVKTEDIKEVPIVKKEEDVKDYLITKEDLVPDEEADVCLAEIRKEELLKIKLKQDALKEEPETKVEKIEVNEPVARAETPETEEDEVEKPKEAPKEDNERVTRNSVIAKSACNDRSSRSRSTIVNQDSMDDKTDDSQDKITPTKVKDKKMTREERKIEAIMKAFERMDREKKKQEVKEKQTKRRESDPVQPTEKEEEDDSHAKKRRKRKGRARTTSQSCRRRVDSADSDVLSEDDNNDRQQRRNIDTHHTRQRHNNEHELGLSPACLLVEAAVGSVESTFKLPKTKKTIANEWIGQSPERTPSPYRSPYRPTLVSAPSLESLVHVASTIIGDLSADESNGSRDRHVNDKPQQHSAKKRWLRQAISEESDSPNAGESPPNEMITPLKKRRLARESLSYDQTPAFPLNDMSSPKMDDSPMKGTLPRQCKTRDNCDSIYCGRDRSRSESGHGSDDQCQIDAANDVLNANVKGPHDSENIRRIIGIPLPGETDEPVIVKVQDLNIINNNIEESAPDAACNSNPEPMEIDTTTPQTEIIDLTDGTNDKDMGSSRSADTSGNSSPQRDEMDDIQKKIHSFHTENIMILKSRNKKPPKEKRKKVNLNFDLNMVDDQISIQLRTNELNGEVAGKPLRWPAPESIPLPPVEPIRWPEPETIPLPPVEPIKWPSPENIPMPLDSINEHALDSIPFPDEPISDSGSPEMDNSVRNTRPFSKLRKQLSKERRNRKVDFIPAYDIPLPTDDLENDEDTYAETEKPEQTPSGVDTVKPVKVEPSVKLEPDDDVNIVSESIVKIEPEIKVESNEITPPVPDMEVPGSLVNKDGAEVPMPPNFEENIEIKEEPQSINSVEPEKIKHVEPHITTNIELEKVTPKETEEVPIQIEVEKVPEKIFETEPVKESISTPQSVLEVVSPKIAINVVEESVVKVTNIETEKVTNIEVEKCSLTPGEPTSVPFSPLGNTTGLFSGIFNNITQSQSNHTMPDVIDNSINHTSFLDKNVFQSTEDEFRSVQEILSRVNKMDATDLISGVLGSTTQGPTTPLRHCRPLDPRLNPPPQDKPKPVRRKLSISEYRKRLKGSAEGEASRKPEEGDGTFSGRTDSEDDLDTRIHRSLVDTQPKGVFDARATCAERVREKLSCRLRREFGLSLPEEEMSNNNTRQEPSPSPSSR